MRHRHIYIMLSKSVLPLCKIGIAYDSDKRDRQVSKSTRRDMLVLVTLPFLFARFWEGVLHGVFWWASHPVRGNGGTEFFWGIITPLAIIALFVAFLIENSVLIAVAFMIVLKLKQ